MHANKCIFDYMNFMLFIIKFINFKPIIKFKKFELRNCVIPLNTCHPGRFRDFVVNRCVNL